MKKKKLEIDFRFNKIVPIVLLSTITAISTFFLWKRNVGSEEYIVASVFVILLISIYKYVEKHLVVKYYYPELGWTRFIPELLLLIVPQFLFTITVVNEIELARVALAFCLLMRGLFIGADKLSDYLSGFFLE